MAWNIIIDPYIFCNKINFQQYKINQNDYTWKRASIPEFENENKVVRNFYALFSISVFLFLASFCTHSINFFCNILRPFVRLHLSRLILHNDAYRDVLDSRIYFLEMRTAKKCDQLFFNVRKLSLELKIFRSFKKNHFIFTILNHGDYPQNISMTNWPNPNFLL